MIESRLLHFASCAAIVAPGSSMVLQLLSMRTT